VIDRFRDGRIIESWGVFDQFGVMEQMGLVRAAPPSYGDEEHDAEST
jgi:hypothetical protein